MTEIVQIKRELSTYVVTEFHQCSYMASGSIVKVAEMIDRYGLDNIRKAARLLETERMEKQEKAQAWAMSHGGGYNHEIAVSEMFNHSLALKVCLILESITDAQKWLACAPSQAQHKIEIARSS